MREPQYQFLLDIEKQEGLRNLGLMTSQLYRDDPKHLVFQLARYKFASKMLAGLDHVLEIGCGDGFSTRLIAQTVQRITSIDFDPVFVEHAKQVNFHDPRMTFLHHDICVDGPLKQRFDGAFCCDVIEHILPRDEDHFVRNIMRSLKSDGVLIVGTPSLESQIYASPPSKAGHVNCKRAPELKALMQKYFRNVFIFSMNDEVVHTGFTGMAHYLFALCCYPRPLPAKTIRKRAQR